MTSNPEDEGEVGHFHLHLNIVGDNGRTGSVRFLHHAFHDGHQERTIEQGTCHFVEDE